MASREFLSSVDQSVQKSDKIHSNERNQNSKGTKQSKKEIVRSFRIRKSDFEELQKEASKKKVTMNSIVEDLIHRHVQYDALVQKFRILGISSYSLGLIADAVPEERLIELARTIHDDPAARDWMFMTDVGRKESVKGVLETMKIFAKNQSYSISETSHDSKKIVFFVHDAGRKWSLFVAHSWKTVFDRLGANVKVSADDRAAIFEFEASEIS